MDIESVDSQKLIESLQEGVVVHNSTTEIVYANPKALKILRLSEGQILGKDSMDPELRFIDVNHKLIAHQDYPVNQVISSNKAISNMEIGICDSSSNHITWVLCSAYPQRTEEGEIEKIIVSFLDITETKHDIPFESVVTNANDIIVITKANPESKDSFEIVYVNHAFTKLTGYSSEEIIGKTPRVLQGEGTSPETRSRIREAVLREEAIRETILNYSKSGVPYWLDMNIFPLLDSLGRVSYFAAVERDSTGQVNRIAELTDISIKDPLTNLMNRRGFYDLVNQKTQSDSLGECSSFAIIDVDFFKRINDSFGHECGDEALKFLSNKLVEIFRKDDLICRFGGEEFVVLLPNTGIVNGQKKMEQFRKEIASTPFEISADKSITLTVSVGMSLLELNESSLEDVIKEADKALYNAKESGRNRVVLFNRNGSVDSKV